MHKTPDPSTKLREAPAVTTQSAIRSKPPNTFAKIFKLSTDHDLEHFTNYDKFTKWLHRPVDASALGLFRIFYGKIKE